MTFPSPSRYLKKDAVIAALKEYIVRKKQLEIAELFGKINFDKNYDYKKARINGGH